MRSDFRSSRDFRSLLYPENTLARPLRRRHSMGQYLFTDGDSEQKRTYHSRLTYTRYGPLPPLFNVGFHPRAPRFQCWVRPEMPRPNIENGGWGAGIGGHIDYHTEYTCR